jgi:hypothetical protein
MKNNVTGAYVVIFDGDGRMDLARAGAFDSVGTKFNSGAVDVLHGSSLKRLGASNNQLWKQDSSGGKILQNLVTISDGRSLEKPRNCTTLGSVFPISL